VFTKTNVATLLILEHVKRHDDGERGSAVFSTAKCCDQYFCPAPKGRLEHQREITERQSFGSLIRPESSVQRRQQHPPQGASPPSITKVRQGREAPELIFPRPSDPVHTCRPLRCGTKMQARRCPKVQVISAQMRLCPLTSFASPEQEERIDEPIPVIAEVRVDSSADESSGIALQVLQGMSSNYHRSTVSRSGPEQQPTALPPRRCLLAANRPS
jgi:hypothetical protein